MLDSEVLLVFLKNVICVGVPPLRKQVSSQKIFLFCTFTGTYMLKFETPKFCSLSLAVLHRCAIL